MTHICLAYIDKSIHIKSGDVKEGKMLAAMLKQYPGARLQKIAVYGADQPIAAVKTELPDLSVMSKAVLNPDFARVVYNGQYNSL